MLLLILGSVFSGRETKFDLYIQNQDNDSDLSLAFIKVLNQTNIFQLRIIPKEGKIEEYLKEKNPFSPIRILIIPKGFQNNLLNSTLSNKMNITVTTLKDLLKRFSEFIPKEAKESANKGLSELEKLNLKGEEVNLIFIYDPSDLMKESVKNIILNVFNNFYQRILGINQSLVFENRESSVRSLKPVEYYLPGIIGAFVMTNGVIGVTQVMAGYKRTGLIKRLAITPLSKFEWVLGNLITQTILSLLLTLAMLIAALLFFNVINLPDPLTLITLVIGSLCFSGLGLILGGLVKDIESATALSNTIAFPMMFLAGSFFPIEIMPKFMQALSNFIPLTYFNLALRSSLILKDLPTTLSNLSLIGILAIIFLTIASLTLKWREG
ncbi:hypothetical protein HRbin06_00508 [archaeon HR06]|nr:hypothetical protein HRbin06_00508 [archaeon HR06]